MSPVCVAAMLLLASPARVVLVRVADDALTRAIASELRSLAFEVVEVSSRPGDAWLVLQEETRSRDAVAGVHVVPSGETLQLWVNDRLTGKVTLRAVKKEGSTGTGARITALRTVELLRFSLSELNEPAAPRGEVVEVPAEVVKVVARPWVFGLSAGAAGLASSGGLTPAAGVTLAGRWAPGRLVFDLWGLIPFLPSVRLIDGGRLQVTPFSVQTGAAWQLTDGLSRLNPEVGLIAGAVLLDAMGAVSPPQFGRRVAGGSAVVGARAALGLRLSSAVVAVAEVRGGLTFPAQALVVDGRVEATFGPFWVGGGVSVEVRLPGDGP